MRGWRVLAVAAWAVGPGCVVHDAPETLEELVVYGFTGFGDDEAVDTEVSSALRPLIDTHEQALVDGLRVDDLTQDNLDDAGVDTTLQLGIVGVAARVQMQSALADVVRVWSSPHMDEVLDVTTGFEVRAEDGDRDCFLAGDCLAYSYDGWRENDYGILGTGTQEFTRSFRRAAMDDGTEVVVIRELIPDGTEMNSAVVRIHAQFSYAVLYPHDGGTLRFNTYWIDAEAIGIELPDYFALDMSVNQMNATAEEVDAYIAGE